MEDRNHLEDGNQLNAPLSCGDYQGEIPLVIGADLEPEIMDLLVAHLADCDPCADLTAQAARARDVLLEGLALGVDQWKEPKLWPGIAAAMGTGVSPLLPRPKPVHGLRLLRRSAQVIAIAAVAATLLLVFKPWSSEQPAETPFGGQNQPNPNVADSQAEPLNGPALSSNGVGESLASADLERPMEALPAGLVPLTERDLRELSEAAPLWVDMSRGDGVLEIRQGQGQTLASFPTR